MTASRNGYRARTGTKRRTVEQRVNAKRATAHLHVPDRGDDDPHTGAAWGGFGRMKMEFRGLTEEEQATNSTDARVLASDASNDNNRAVTTNAIRQKAITNEKVNDLDGGKLHPLSVGNDKLGNNIQGKKLKHKSVSGDKIISIPVSKVKGMPDLNKFATSKDITSAVRRQTAKFVTTKDAAKYVTRNEVQNLIDKATKKKN